MTPYLQDADFTLYVGDVREQLASLPDESVHCVVTSPPYWGLRDYGTGTWDGGDPDCEHSVGGQVQDTKAPGAITTGQRPGVDASTCRKCGARRVDQQLGLEPTPDEYVTRMVEVFREVRRVLRADGTCWVNLGDSYAGAPVGSFNGGGFKDKSAETGGRDLSGVETSGRMDKLKASGLKQKDLVGIPWRVAFALQADGWYLRSDIIWSKPNPMPESVTDRPTKAHEYLFLLSKSPRYFFDQEAVREPAEWRRWGDQTYSPEAEAMYGQRVKPRTKAELTPRNDGNRWNEADGRGFVPNQAGRNIRSVWEITTQPYPEAHFATYPEELVRRCILAGTSERGCCPVCGKPWETSVEYDAQGRTTNGPRSTANRHESPGRDVRMVKEVTTLGWRPGCECLEKATRYFLAPPNPIPCTVLDPFMGSGTTAYVARAHGRRSIGIELNPDYCELAARRLQQQSLFA